MASSFCWLSVLVKFRASKQRTIVKCSWLDNFGALLEKLSMSETVVCKIKICKNESCVIQCMYISSSTSITIITPRRKDFAYGSGFAQQFDW